MCIIRSTVRQIRWWCGFCLGDTHLKTNAVVGGLGVVAGWGRRRDHALVVVAVLLERVEDVLRVGVHQVGPRLPQRVHDVVDEADLRFLDRRVLAVAHRADVEADLALLVALLEELLHQQRHPPLVQRQRLRRVAKVGTMHQILQNLVTQTQSE